MTFSREPNLIALNALVLALLIYAGPISVRSLPDAGQNGLPRNALWAIVHEVCVPGQLQNHDPTPCLTVDLNDGIEKGFAILRDPRRVAQFLLVPTIPISGIESPSVLHPAAPNYFADAWKSRSLLETALGRNLPRDAVGMAINSAMSRSQDQLHIHIACVHSDVLEALRRNQEQIHDRWAPFRPSLRGRDYESTWVRGDELGSNNPFRLLAENLPGAAISMSYRTLVVIGLTRTNGKRGFVLLTDHADRDSEDWANGEDLLDHTCKIAVLYENRNNRKKL